MLIIGIGSTLDLAKQIATECGLTFIAIELSPLAGGVANLDLGPLQALVTEPPEAGLCLAIDNRYLNDARALILAHASSLRLPLRSLISPMAMISKEARLGSNIIIGAGSIIDSGCRIASGCVIGRYSIIQAQTSIGRACQIGDRCIIGSGATVGNLCSLGHGVQVVENIVIGKRSQVDLAGYQVLESLPESVIINSDFPQSMRIYHL